MLLIKAGGDWAPQLPKEAALRDAAVIGLSSVDEGEDASWVICMGSSPQVLSLSGRSQDSQSITNQSINQQTPKHRTTHQVLYMRLIHSFHHAFGKESLLHVLSKLLQSALATVAQLASVLSRNRRAEGLIPAWVTRRQLIDASLCHRCFSFSLSLSSLPLPLSPEVVKRCLGVRTGKQRNPKTFPNRVPNLNPWRPLWTNLVSYKTNLSQSPKDQWE